MTLHLIQNFTWVQCGNRSECPKALHSDDGTGDLHKLPISWVEKIMECVITAESIEFFDIDMRPHREDGPAVERFWNGNNEYEWYLHGKKHRIGGPAWTNANGMFSWNQNGEYHREDGPAVRMGLPGEHATYWYLNGERHREDGPAVIGVEGKLWFRNGVEYTRWGKPMNKFFRFLGIVRAFTRIMMEQKRRNVQHAAERKQLMG